MGTPVPVMSSLRTTYGQSFKLTIINMIVTDIRQRNNLHVK